jgi:uncharacterized damage-inducible protein DinB
MTPIEAAEMTQDLRYPIGQFNAPSSYSTGERAANIETLRLLPERLKSAVAGLTGPQLEAPYREGGWTIRQVVHHVADSHANAYIRVRLALTEDWPTVKSYDEAVWAELYDARSLPVGVSLDLLTALHARWVALAESLTEADLERGYVHPEMGRQNVVEVLALYSWHGRHHTAHITNLRTRMGW